MKKEFIQSFKIIFLGLLLSAGLSFAAGTQTPPPSPAFSNNPDIPIYVSAILQAKGGATLTGSLLNINGLLSSNSLAILGNASIPGNGASGNGTLQVASLNQANNPSVSTWPAPVCNDTAGKLILCAPSAPPPPPPPPGSFSLSVTKSGNGTVTSSPSGINCGSTCSASYTSPTSVTLTAAPASGNTFSGWSGSGCTGTGTCVVSMTQARSVTATFAVIPPPPTGSQTYTPGSTSGTLGTANPTTFQVPAGVTSITVKAWGGGGSGGAGQGNTPNNYGGGGGGGGGYSQTTYNVSSITSLQVIAGSANQPSYVSFGGGPTYIVRAFKGAAGFSGGGSSAGAGGAGGGGDYGTITTGISGQSRSGSAGGDGGAGANGGAGGLDGGTGASAVAGAGTSPGGGGSGGAGGVSQNHPGKSGGAGGAGRVEINW